MTDQHIVWSIPVIVMLSGVVGVGGRATPLVMGLLGVLNIRSVKEKVPLSTVSNLNRRSSFQAAVSISSSFPVTGKQLSNSMEAVYLDYTWCKRPSNLAGASAELG